MIRKNTEISLREALNFSTDRIATMQDINIISKYTGLTFEPKKDDSNVSIMGFDNSLTHN